MYPRDLSTRNEDWGDGVVFSFSVVTPNVNYPPAIFPLMFRGKNTVSVDVMFSIGVGRPNKGLLRKSIDLYTAVSIATSLRFNSRPSLVKCGS